MLRVTIPLLTLILLVHPGSCPALQVSSLQPTTAIPGERVTLGGSDWPHEFQLLLGETAVPYDRISNTAVRFQVPELPAGEYAIGIRSDSGSSRATTRFVLSITSPPPLIDMVDPNLTPFCRPGEQTEVVIYGQHFSSGASLLLDESSLPVKERESGSITVVLPQIPAGLHRLQVVNPDGQKSLATTIEVADQPRIDQLQVGSDDQVVSYQIRIVGANFTPQSKLLVNGAAVINRPGLLEEGDDRVTYLDCATLLYQRFPMSGQQRELQFQVLNPDGQVSNVVTLSSN